MTSSGESGVSLRGRSVFVTGGNSGIGLATALLFAREGADVAILSLGEEASRTAQTAIEANGVRCLAFTGDVTREQDMAAAVEATCATFGGLHYAFNNAGLSQRPSPIPDQNEAYFDQIVATNLKGTWLGLKHQIPAIVRSGGGAIVNNSSAAGVKGAPGQGIYCAAKHAVIGLTRAAALDHAAQGLRINPIAPGVVRTPMSDAFAAANPAEWKIVLDRRPIREPAETSEVAAAVLFLCRDATKTTGSTLMIDGGLSA